MMVPERGHLILPFHGRELDFNKTPTSLKEGGGGFLKDVHYNAHNKLENKFNAQYTILHVQPGSRQRSSGNCCVSSGRTRLTLSLSSIQTKPERSLKSLRTRTKNLN